MFRFTIRDVLWLMVVVGLAVALLQSRAALNEERKSVAEWSSKAGAALRAIQANLPGGNWHGTGIVVVEKHESGANYHKIYPGK